MYVPFVFRRFISVCLMIEQAINGSIVSPIIVRNEMDRFLKVCSLGRLLFCLLFCY